MDDGIVENAMLPLLFDEQEEIIGLNYRSGAKANWKHEFGLILAKIWHFSKNYLIKNSRKSLTHSLSFIYLEDDFISQKLLA